MNIEKLLIKLKPGQNTDLKIQLKPANIELASAIVKPKREKYSKKENPAVELIRNVIENKGKNRIEAKEYFNAGVLVMNLAKFRESNFYDAFCRLLKTYKFSVAQDQDYLNVLCAGKVVFIGGEWNKMPIGGMEKNAPKLIHYNLTMKPWHYEDVLYKEHFWKYAKKVEDYPLILDALYSYTEEKKAKDKQAEKNLLALCVQEALRTDNYLKKWAK